MATTDDQNMEDLMQQWDKDNNVAEATDDSDSSDDEPLSYDDMLEKFRRTVDQTNNSIDHIVLGVSDLDKAVEDFEALTGMKPLMVVTQNGLGTKCARIAFESCAFIELLGPDPKQKATDQSEKLSKLPAGKFVPVHYAVRNNKANDLKNSVWQDEMKFECDQVTMIAKEKGMPWKWDMFFLEGHSDGGLVPFFINWGEATHAAARLPIVGKLEGVKITSNNDNIPKLLDGIDGVTVGSGADQCVFTFTSSKGTHTFECAAPMGISFPK